MTWDDHSNETSEPLFWLDGLDIPMVQFFDASFAEGSEEAKNRITGPAGDSFARYGHNLLPVDSRRASKTSPIFNYPYSYTREALEQAKVKNEWDACHGLKLKFSNPETGDFAMPTIGTFIQLLPKGFKTARYRSTDATVFAAIEGKGRSRIGEQSFEWGPRDLFVVPSWQWVTHEAEEDSVLFSFSDRPVQQKLDLFREDRDRSGNTKPGENGGKRAGPDPPAHDGVKRNVKTLRHPDQIARHVVDAAIDRDRGGKEYPYRNGGDLRLLADPEPQDQKRQQRDFRDRKQRRDEGEADAAREAREPDGKSDADAGARSKNPSRATPPDRIVP